MSSKSAKGKVQNGNTRHNPVRGAGAVVIGGIVPHPPIMVPEVGGTQARKTRVTQDALLELGRRICRSGAETMVFISPHGPVLWDAVGVVNRAQLEGNLGRFGAREVAFTLHTDSTLLQTLLEQLAVLGVPNAEIGEADVYRLDHGITAPLYWLRKAGVDLPVVACGTAFISPFRLYGFGVAVQRAAALSGRNVAVVASGDLSHRLLPEAPNGYDPYGPLFDQRIKEIVAAADPMAMIGLDPLLVERAGECGYRPMIMLFGAFDGFVLDAEVLSYEGPFGVGYMVAGLTPGREDRGRRYLEQLVRDAEARIKTESFLVRVARKAIEHHLKFGRRVEVREIPHEFNRRAAVFVSLKKGDALRGCIGTVEPSQPDLVREVVENAVSAATRDPRFDPVGPSETQDLTISVDVLGELEPVSGLEELDPKRYGVVVSGGSGRGLLLPDLEGVDTPEQQVSIARRKAGISAGEPVRIERFKVIRYR